MDDKARQLPFIARAYIAAVIVGALFVAGMYAASEHAVSLFHSSSSLEVWFSALLLMAIGLLIELNPIPIPTTHLFDDSRYELALSTSVYLAALLLYGPAFALLVGAPPILVADCWRRKALYKSVFNAAQYVVTVGVAGLLLAGIESDSYLLRTLLASPYGLFLLMAAMAGYFSLNTALVAAVVAMVDGTRFLEVWRHSIRQMLLEHAAMVNIGLVAAILWMVSPLCLVLLVLPIMVVFLSSRTTSQLKMETMRALVAVAEMVESRDPYSYRHSLEVGRISAQIATRLGLPLDQVEMVKLAGQLHDIGKMGTPDHVLNKPGRLDEGEWRLMKKHPSDGAKVLRYFSLFQPGVDLVLYHQEHFDGSGYPAGLAGIEIPIGARIIQVADAFQAMTSDRVYRKALEPSVAMERLQAAAGTQFDPEIVKVLLDLLKEPGVPPEGGASPPPP